MTIHKALVAAQSTALRGLVTGSMEEANSGKVVWEDVDEDTFALQSLRIQVTMQLH